MLCHYDNKKSLMNEKSDSEIRLDSVFRVAPIGIGVVIDRVIVEANLKLAEITGYSQDELTGMNSRSLYPSEEEFVYVGEEKYRQINEKGTGSVETKWVKKDGTTIDILLSSTPLEINNLSRGVTFTALDISQSKNAEESLRQSEFSLRKSQEKINEQYSLLKIAGERVRLGGWSFNVEENSLHWSDEVAIIHETESGFVPDVSTGINFYAPEWREIIIDKFNKCVLFGEPYDLELQIITAKGKRLWVRTIAEALRDNSGNIYKVQGAFQDITDIREAREKIREKDIQFRKLSANVSDLIFQFTRRPDGSYCVPIASEGIKNIFGCSPEDVTDNFEPIAKVIHPDDNERVIRDIEYSAKNLTYFTCEFRVCIPGKPIQWIFSRSTPERLPDGSITWYGFNADITERKHAEEELRKLSRAVEQSINAVIIANIKGEIEYANPAACTLTGFSLAELLAMNIQELCVSSDKSITCDEIWKKINLGEAWTGEVLNNRKNGEEYWESSIISPILNEKGVLVNFLAIKKDITHDKKLSEELIKAKVRAEESDKLKTAFLSNMSHEIRTPMNGILGFAELLKEPDLTHEQILEYISIIERSGQRMLNIINDITDIARIESGQMKISVHKSNINELIKEIYRFFDLEAQKKGLNLSYKTALEPEDAIITTDREKLYAILLNLIKNSLKFTFTGGITFGYDKEGDFLVFYVKDTGIGIPKDKQGVIFERFVQADMSNSRLSEGTGLGLSISKAFVEMLGGSIRLESEEGKGSCFWFTIPYMN